MVVVAQLVRAPDCGSGSRRFEPDLPPLRDSVESLFLYRLTNCILQKSEYKFKNDLHLIYEKQTDFGTYLARFLVEIHSRLCLSLQLYRDSDEITLLNLY